MQQNTHTEHEDLRSKVVTGLLLVGGIYITYRIGNKIISEIHKKNTQSQADDSPEVRQAIALRSAMNPSGIRWMMSFDTTNTSIVLNTAQTITNLDKVSQAYKNLYADNLLDDLQSELSAAEYEKFFNLVTSNPAKNTSAGSAAPIKYAKANELVVCKKEVYIRTTPDASNHGKIYEQFSSKNIIRLAKPGEFLGYATGKQAYDSVNNVKFIEVAFVVNGVKAPDKYKAKNKQAFTYWVSSSNTYVDIFSYYKNMFDTYPATIGATQWMKPRDYFTLKGIAMPRLLTLRDTSVLDEQLVPINQAGPNTILGQLIMSMNTGDQEYLQFRTVDNTIRWVNNKNILLQQ